MLDGLEARGEVVEPEGLAGAEEHRGLEHVRQLADIAGPSIVLERGLDLWFELGDLPAVAGVGPGEEMGQEDRKIFATVTQSRDAEFDHAEAVV